MAAGDVSDIARRLRELHPRRWLPDEAPVASAVLRGMAVPLAWIHDFLAKVRLQARIATATGEWLDLVAFDYLGDRISRRAGETDAAFRTRIRREILREKVTRKAVEDNLEDLTGYRPKVFEPSNPRDTGGYGHVFAFDAGGGWGTTTMPHQAFVTAYRPLGEGPPNISGFDDAPGSFGPGRFALQSQEALDAGVTDAVIAEAVATSLAAGTVVWLRVRPFSESPDGARLDDDFILDVSRLS